MPHQRSVALSLALAVAMAVIIVSVSANPSPQQQAGSGSVQQQRKVRLLSQQPALARLYRMMIGRSGAGYLGDDDDSILEDAESYLQKRQQYDDYGHMRFGKRNPKDFDDYGHMRFGK